MFGDSLILAFGPVRNIVLATGPYKVTPPGGEEMMNHPRVANMDARQGGVILTVPSILNKLVVHQMKIVHGGHND
jgi:hypothetical protein